MVNQDDVYLTPEQVAEKLQLAVETVYRWLRSGKLRGSRMSPKAWRIADLDVRSFMTRQNVSELLFEDYLSLHQLGVPDHEPPIRGKSRRIDYRLPFKNQVLWFEVKEFAEAPNRLDGLAETYGVIQNPHIGIRQKIDRAAEKFREYQGECCSLVLYNSTLNLNLICTPEMVFAAMLGDLRLDNSGAWILKGGGRLQPQLNTRISAVIALEQIQVGQREFRIALTKKQRSENRRLSGEEAHDLFKNRLETHQRTALRVLVYENLHAAKRLPEDIFTGPLDERWGPVDNQRIKRLYIGSELADLEAEERALRLA
jgi:excisionase family DNA binding protein